MPQITSQGAKILNVSSILGLLAAAVCLGNTAAWAQTLVLQGGRIIPVVGRPINKGSILIRDGRIVEVGRKIKAPFDAKVIDVSGKTLFPGMIDVHAAGGLDRPNESPPLTPFLNVYDAIDPSQLFFEDALRDGVTSIHVIVGNDCVIGGMSRVVHPIGMTPDEMTTAPDIALKLSLTPKSGFDRMLQMATFREAFRKLDENMANLAEKRYEESLREQDKDLDVPPDEAKKRGRKLIRDEDIDAKDRNLLLLTQGKLKAFVYCGKPMDVPAAVKLAKAHGFFEQTMFVLGAECYKAVDVLKKAGRPVVLDAELLFRETDPITGEETETFVPSVIDKAGLKFALQRRPRSTLGERYLWYQAARCVREGIDRDKAIKAITLWPAEMLGLAARLGSIETGKDANILVLSGDPLDMNTWVETVFIQGQQVYQRSEDIRLKKLLSSPEEDLGPSSAPTKGAKTSAPASSQTESAPSGRDRAEEKKTTDKKKQ